MLTPSAGGAVDLEAQLPRLIDDSGQWYGAYGNENWEFNAEGIMHHRYASINDLRISESDRLFHWPQGRRPEEHPELIELGL